MWGKEKRESWSLLWYGYEESKNTRAKINVCLSRSVSYGFSFLLASLVSWGLGCMRYSLVEESEREEHSKQAACSCRRRVVGFEGE